MALRAAWPPADPPAGDYRGVALAGTRLLGACPLPGGSLVALAGDADGGLVALPVVAEDAGGFRAALAGDGAAAALVAALRSPAAGRSPGFALVADRPGAIAAEAGPAFERAIAADQTNASVVVGDAVVVKWIRRPDPMAERAAGLRRRLAAAGFREAPELLGTLEATTPGGAPVTIAYVDAYLPGVVDGWDWTVDALLAHASEAHACGPACPARFGAELGALASRLHAALATPTPADPTPVGEAGEAAPRGWAARAGAVLGEALAATAGDDPAAGERLRPLVPALRARIDLLAGLTGTRIQAVHGDLHVGQLPRWRGGIAVVDLDGNPALPPALRGERQPAARDLAQLRCSIDLVGRIALRRIGERTGATVERADADRATVRSWIEAERAACLAGYRAGPGGPLLDERLLAPFEAEQVARELLYAARFLPRWRAAALGLAEATVAR